MVLECRSAVFSFRLLSQAGPSGIAIVPCIPTLRCRCSCFLPALTSRHRTTVAPRSWSLYRCEETLHVQCLSSLLYSPMPEYRCRLADCKILSQDPTCSRPDDDHAIVYELLNYLFSPLGSALPKAPLGGTYIDARFSNPSQIFTHRNRDSDHTRRASSFWFALNAPDYISSFPLPKERRLLGDC